MASYGTLNPFIKSIELHCRKYDCFFFFSTDVCAMVRTLQKIGAGLVSRRSTLALNVYTSGPSGLHQVYQYNERVQN